MKKKKYYADCEQEFKEGENRRFKRCSECREVGREYQEYLKMIMGGATDTLGLGIPDTDEWEYFHRDLEDMG